MATQKLFEVFAAEGTTISIEYNDANLRVGNISFTVPVGESAHVLLWDNGALIYNNVYVAGSYSENVPGNYKVVETIEDGETVYRLPPIAWSYSRIRP